MCHSENDVRATQQHDVASQVKNSCTTNRFAIASAEAEHDLAAHYRFATGLRVVHKRLAAVAVRRHGTRAHVFQRLNY